LLAHFKTSKARGAGLARSSKVKGVGVAVERRRGPVLKGSESADEVVPVLSGSGSVSPGTGGCKVLRVAGWSLRAKARVQVFGLGRGQDPRRGRKVMLWRGESQKGIGHQFGATRVGANGLAGGSRLRSG
jgi:hypothetical protein